MNTETLRFTRTQSLYYAVYTSVYPSPPLKAYSYPKPRSPPPTLNAPSFFSIHARANDDGALLAFCFCLAIVILGKDQANIPPPPPLTPHRLPLTRKLFQIWIETANGHTQKK